MIQNDLRTIEYELFRKDLISFRGWLGDFARSNPNNPSTIALNSEADSIQRSIDAFYLLLIPSCFLIS